MPQYAENCGIKIHILTEEEALVARWLEFCHILFPYDWAFHEKMARAIESISSGATPETVLETLEGVPFDEWDVFARYGLCRHSEEALAFLRFQALNHYDYDWRAGTISWMLNEGLLSVQEAWGMKGVFEDTTDTMI